ncbi:MAG: GTPase HflX [Proteobacteria bacterium]|nr:MAG: GTPase HflX [Pseudomonadota bacterium]
MPQRAGSTPIRVFGNTQGLKASQVHALERLYRRRLPSDRLVTHEFARELTQLSHELGREVGVLIDRRGEVTHAMVGTQAGIEMPEWGRLRAGQGRLRGLRCVHTYLGDDALTHDDLTDLAKLRLDAMVTLGMDRSGLPTEAHVAHLRPARQDGTVVERLAPVPPARLDLDFADWVAALEQELSRTTTTRAVGARDRAVLVAVSAGRGRDETDEAVTELRELARSAGVEVADVVVQVRPQIDPRTVIGSGRLEDLVVRAFQHDADLVIFDHDLSPAQARNIAGRLELRVIDRTQLILDIFAQRARSRDGKLQVELAQLEYRLPRLAQQDLGLSRLGGGIGGRGPGEQRLEVDRRRVRDRIARLERELAHLGREREGRRNRRNRRDVPVLSIVGYTNAGKSTLLRALTNADVLVEDKLFATLDPTSRRLRFPREREVIVTDTVGFIRDLPDEMKQAFRATLEELRDADLFLHVVDAAAPDAERRIAAVRGVLDEMGLADTPELLVFNQIDRLEPGQGEAIAARAGGVAVAALHGVGLRELLERVEKTVWLEGTSLRTRERLCALAGGEPEPAGVAGAGGRR